MDPDEKKSVRNKGNFSVRETIIRSAQIPVEKIEIPRDVTTIMRKIEGDEVYTQFIVGEQSKDVALAEGLSCRFTKPVMVTQIPQVNPARSDDDVVVNGGKATMFVGAPPNKYFGPWATNPDYSVVIHRWAPLHPGSQTLGLFKPLEMEIHKGKLTPDSRADNLPDVALEATLGVTIWGTYEDRLTKAKIAYKAAKAELGIECTQAAALTPAQLLAMAEGTPLYTPPVAEKQERER
jgi:hypothetical protein